VQHIALESLGGICQSWPAEFNKTRLRELFTASLSANGSNQGIIGTRQSQLIALRAFEELYSSMALIKDEPDKDGESVSETQDLKKMGGTKKAQDDSSALSSMATHIFNKIVDVALQGHGEAALLAMKFLSSVAARGMFHPRDYAHVFLALETTDDPELRAAAEKAHQVSHQHHESHWEREYVNAVRQAFVYQQRHTGDAFGSWKDKAKLAACFKVVNTSGSKYVKKFVSALISKLGIDYTKIDASSPSPNHVLWVRFVAQNLAFFDYVRQDDLLHTVLQLELAFSKNSGEIVQAIETNFPQITQSYMMGETNGVTDPAEVALTNGELPTEPAAIRPGEAVDVEQLRCIVAGAAAARMLLEAKSYLKRQYGISRDVRAAMQQNKQAKESTKPPLRVHGITGDRFLAATDSLLPLSNEVEDLMRQCRASYDVLSVDDEVRVAEDGEDFRESYSASVDFEGMQQPRSATKKRKRETPSLGGTPSKRPRGRPRKSSTSNGIKRSGSVSSKEDPDGEYWD
jgi:cohesin loading factor subunit SCC2